MVTDVAELLRKNSRAEKINVFVSKQTFGLNNIERNP